MTAAGAKQPAALRPTGKPDPRSPRQIRAVCRFDCRIWWRRDRATTRPTVRRSASLEQVLSSLFSQTAKACSGPSLISYFRHEKPAGEAGGKVRRAGVRSLPRRPALGEREVTLGKRQATRGKRTCSLPFWNDRAHATTRQPNLLLVVPPVGLPTLSPSREVGNVNFPARY